MWPSLAGATPEYPLVIDNVLEVTCPRPNSRCLICHTTARGGQRTAEQSFVRELDGLTRGKDPGALSEALRELDEDVDSDGDGVGDKEELRGCGNPSGEELGFGPEYGCDGAHLAREARGDAPLLLLATLLAGLFVRPRRARQGREGREPGRR